MAGASGYKPLFNARLRLQACPGSRRLPRMLFFMIPVVLLGLTGLYLHFNDSSFQGALETVTARVAGTDPCSGISVRNPQFAKNVRGVKVLVTGGAGFIGSNLVDRLLELGYSVRVFDNLATGSIRYVPLENENVEFMLGDIANFEEVDKASEDVEYVYHLAAMSKVVPSLKSPDMARFCTEVNALGTWNVLEAARKHKVKKVMYAGSSTYYGNQPIPHSETDAPDFLTPYAASKYEGEMQMKMFDSLFDVPTVILRFFMVFGPRQPSTGAYAIVTGVFAHQAALDQPLTIEGDGTHSRDFIHVKDIVEGLIVAQQRKDIRSQVINLGTGKGYSVKEVADLVSPNQSHVDPRKNDLVATLADTCAMKKVLGFVPRMEFKKEMSAIANATMAGNPFNQKWATPEVLSSAPWIMPSGTNVVDGAGVHTDLHRLIEAVCLRSADFDGIVSVFVFDKPSKRMLLMNSIHSLIKYGGIKTYIVACTKPATLDLCKNMNFPCLDVSQYKDVEHISRLRMRLAFELLRKGLSVHAATTNVAYVRDIASTFSSDIGADLFVNKELRGTQYEETLGNFVARASVRNVKLFEALIEAGDQNLLTAFVADENRTWQACANPDQCKKATAAGLAAVFEYSNALRCYTHGTPAVDPCESNHLYLPVCYTLDDEEATLNVTSPNSWFLTACPNDKVECELQQNIPTSWTTQQPSADKSCASPIEDLRVMSEDAMLPRKLTTTEFAEWFEGTLKDILTEPVLIPHEAANDLLYHTGQAGSPTCKTHAISSVTLNFDWRNQFLLTPTYARDQRVRAFGRHIASISEHLRSARLRCETTNGEDCRDLVWFIAEDSACLDPDILELLNCSKVPYVYFAFGPTRKWGHAQKNVIIDLTIRLTRDFKFSAAVHPLDDDSYVHPQSFDLLYNTRRFSFIPVHGLGPYGVEYAIPDEHGMAASIKAGWMERKFPLDMNGMAWNTSLFDNYTPAQKHLYWPYPTRGGESEFVSEHLTSIHEIEVPCRDDPKCATIFYNKEQANEDRVFECPT
ncbi:hypothetical protein BC832DRAFT_592660 [Gaertneriomyces semiglobifer]|nr:hypothetical protein BC832DRAFT_592660 [Gaertneriomyces semiglobifer]